MLFHGFVVYIALARTIDRHEATRLLLGANAKRDTSYEPSRRSPDRCSHSYGATYGDSRRSGLQVEGAFGASHAIYGNHSR